MSSTEEKAEQSDQNPTPTSANDVNSKCARSSPTSDEHQPLEDIKQSDTESIGPSPPKKRCMSGPTQSSTSIDGDAISKTGRAYGVEDDKSVGPQQGNVVVRYPYRAPTGNTWPPLSAARTSSNVTRSSQTTPFEVSHVSSVGDDLGLSQFPELLSGDVDPEKFLLSHNVDIFNNEEHRQEFINFCERMLAEYYPSQGQYPSVFQNNNNNIMPPTPLPPFLPPPPPQPAAAFNTAPASRSIPNNPIYGTFRPGPLRHQQLARKPPNAQQPAQRTIAAHFFDGQRFVPVQVYVEDDSR